MFEMNSIAVPSEHYSFFTVMMELRKINLVAINKVNLKGHKETLRGIIKYLDLQFKKYKTTGMFKKRNDDIVWGAKSLGCWNKTENLIVPSQSCIK
jgi:hypothetical protein